MIYNLPSRSITILERLPSVAILVFNREKLSYISPLLAEQLGYGGFNTLTMNYRDLMQEDDWRALHEVGENTTRSARFLRLSLSGKKGARAEVNVCADLVCMGKEEWLCLWGVRIPEEQTPCSEEEERERNAQSINFNEDYGATFSHEVRNPLSALIGLVGLLQETPLNEEQQRLVTTINGVADQLMTLLNDMIDSSRFHMGKIVINSTPFALRPLLEMLYSRYELLSPHLRFEFEYDESLPTMVLGDSHRLSQILINLISNAVKFTPSGTISLRVKNLHNSRDILFEVQDTGTGISEETLKRLFSPFERGAEVSKKMGSGLGLYISKQLVEMHGGTISAFSRLGEGCTMQATLPLISADLIGATANVLQDKREEAPSLGAAQRPANAGNERILVVDDNRINVLVVSKYFDKWGVANDAAFSGEEALRKLDTTDYAVIFMDLRMPGMDGFETARRIRTRGDAKAQTPIVALTASTEVGIKERIAQAEMNGYIFKPFKTEELRAIVEQYTQRAPSSPNPKENPND